MIEKLPLVTREIAKYRKPAHFQYRFVMFRLSGIEHLYCSLTIIQSHHAEFHSERWQMRFQI